MPILRILRSNLGRDYGREDTRSDPRQRDLSAYWVGISSMRNFLSIAPSYTSIRDLMLRLCHRLIACSIARRSEAPEKVTMTNLFYLRGMDVGFVSIPNLLARYLRILVSRRKCEVMLSRGQFVAHLVEHFGILTKERLQGLTMIVRDLPMIDMVELRGSKLLAQCHQRFLRVAPDVDEGHWASKRGMDSKAWEFSRFTTWTDPGLSIDDG
ncbi:hypothetical protein Tco_0065324 [Tanacetum coccineum]